MEAKNIIIFLLIITIAGLLFFDLKGKFTANKVEVSGKGNTTEDLGTRIEFYKYLNTYSGLLSDEDFETFSNRMAKLEEDTGKDDSDIRKALVLAMANEVLKDAKTKTIVFELEKKVAILKESSKLNADVLFAKNTECAKLTSNIKDELSKKYKSVGSTTEKEELNFIFYSQSLNTCIYTTKYDYDYFNYSSGKSENYSKNSFRVYDISTNKQLGDYPNYYYKYPFMPEDEAKSAIKKALRSYKKFILENSGYNAKLLNDINY